jgi:hypothetical protein
MKAANANCLMNGKIHTVLADEWLNNRRFTCKPMCLGNAMLHDILIACQLLLLMHMHKELSYTLQHPTLGWTLQYAFKTNLHRLTKDTIRVSLLLKHISYV